MRGDLCFVNHPYFFNDLVPFLSDLFATGMPLAHKEEDSLVWFRGDLNLAPVGAYGHTPVRVPV